MSLSLAESMPLQGAAAGIPQDIHDHFVTCNQTVDVIDERLAVAAKQLEVLRESRAFYIDARQNDISQMVDAMRSRAQRRKDTAPLVPFEQVIKYAGQIGEKAAQTRKKNEQAKAEAEAQAQPPAPPAPPNPGAPPDAPSPPAPPAQRFPSPPSSAGIRACERPVPLTPLRPAARSAPGSAPASAPCTPRPSSRRPRARHGPGATSNDAAELRTRPRDSVDELVKPPRPTSPAAPWSKAASGGEPCGLCRRHREW